VFSGRQAQLLAALQHDVAALFELSRAGGQIAGQPDAAADHGQLAAGRAEPHGHAAVEPAQVSCRSGGQGRGKEALDLR